MNIDEIIKQSLIEDIGDGDHTALATIPATVQKSAKMVMKQDGIICGTIVAKKVFQTVDPQVQVSILIADGTAVKKGDTVMKISGKAASILTAERTALNFIQRMSGIATQTHHLVKILNGLNTKLLDTRKTTPLLRELEKYSVKCGGGENHRFGLFDMMMIKDNHVDFAGGIVPAIQAANEYQQRTGKKMNIEIEVRSLNELQEVLNYGHVQRIMLDNFSPELLKQAVEMVGGRYETEASGGITEKTLREYAITGVDYISVGALTHHISSLDISLLAD